jgi:hypothetical protein
MIDEKVRAFTVDAHQVLEQKIDTVGLVWDRTKHGFDISARAQSPRQAETLVEIDVPIIIRVNQKDR